MSKEDPMLTDAALSVRPSGPPAIGFTLTSSQDSLFHCDDSSSSMDFETAERVHDYC